MNQKNKINVEKKMPKMIIEVDGQWEERNISFSVDRYGEVVDYPELKPYEHFYENSETLRVFTSPVK